MSEMEKAGASSSEVVESTEADANEEEQAESENVDDLKSGGDEATGGGGSEDEEAMRSEPVEEGDELKIEEEGSDAVSDTIGTPTSEMYPSDYGSEMGSEAQTSTTVLPEEEKSKRVSKKFSARIHIDQETLNKNLSVIATDGKEAVVIPGKVRIESAATSSDSSASDTESSPKQKLLIQIAEPTADASGARVPIVLKAKGRAEYEGTAPVPEDLQKQYAQGVNARIFLKYNIIRPSKTTAVSESQTLTSEEKAIEEGNEESTTGQVEEEEVSTTQAVSVQAEPEEAAAEVEESVKLSSESEPVQESLKDIGLPEVEGSGPEISTRLSATNQEELVKEVNMAYNLKTPEGTHTIDETGAYIGAMKAVAPPTNRYAAVPSTCVKKVEKVVPPAAKLQAVEESSEIPSAKQQRSPAMIREDLASIQKSEQGAYAPVPTRARAEKSVSSIYHSAVGIKGAIPPPLVASEESSYVAPKSWWKKSGLSFAGLQRRTSSPPRQTSAVSRPGMSPQESAYMMSPKQRIAGVPSAKRGQQRPAAMMSEDGYRMKQYATPASQVEPTVGVSGQESVYMFSKSARTGLSPSATKATGYAEGRVASSEEQARFGGAAQESVYLLPASRRGKPSAVHKSADTYIQRTQSAVQQPARYAEETQESAYMMPSKPKGITTSRARATRRPGKGAYSPSAAQESSYVPLRSPTTPKTTGGTQAGLRRDQAREKSAEQSEYMAPPKWKEPTKTPRRTQISSPTAKRQSPFQQSAYLTLKKEPPNGTSKGRGKGGPDQH